MSERARTEIGSTDDGDDRAASPSNRGQSQINGQPGPWGKAAMYCVQHENWTAKLDRCNNFFFVQGFGPLGSLGRPWNIQVPPFCGGWGWGKSVDL